LWGVSETHTPSHTYFGFKDSSVRHLLPNFDVPATQYKMIRCPFYKIISRHFVWNYNIDRSLKQLEYNKPDKNWTLKSPSPLLNFYSVCFKLIEIRCKTILHVLLKLAMFFNVFPLICLTKAFNFFHDRLFFEKKALVFKQETNNSFKEQICLKMCDKKSKSNCKSHLKKDFLRLDV